MSGLILPDHYEAKLSIIDTEIAIKLCKDTFEQKLAEKLNLTRVSAPLFVQPETGLNDNLNGYERPVCFDVRDTKETVQIVQSLAKWKRFALKKYGFKPGTGLYTDMNAIRRDEDLDNIHSVYVDQWDWEKVITENTRNVNTLNETVRLIVSALKETEETLKAKYPNLTPDLNEDVVFLTSQQLEDEYPELTPKQREDKVCKKYGTVFISQIGGVLKSGNPHDGRSPDYDDWNLNGDILVWNPVLKRSFELSSMGIRVNGDRLMKQLKEKDCEDRISFMYHKLLLNGDLPLTIGGGIGQSRLCMYMLQTAHIGEVQVSIWPDDMIEKCQNHGIQLL
ncbi:Aspartate--ammonia ligase [Tritrichomonas foetus]|uniref:Aspartate--ammonia ligase n=1 Tax=Tritrichomonas foetus TaxID=1144522 RepID=A0A1J4JTW7_9EUKA|nr:Aspartate--ammonia ligase [Tritrichomonas foetus]|eukprot:OHT00948.1 Aspartate--ammonia ligase [Tritrichomonas foetus]